MPGGKLVLVLALGSCLLAESPDDAAVLAIKAVRSVTSAGVTLRAYSDRVLEARVRADQAANLDPKSDCAFLAAGEAVLDHP